jgi:sulfopropanediol 3-dehydrogenase
MLAGLRERGEDEARTLAHEFDGWDGPIVVEKDAVREARKALAPTLIDDITGAHRNIQAFARAQRDSLQPFEIEVSPGLRAGHRLVPVNVSGCYVPAGRFAHIASALMSVATSSVAGVETIVVASPARDDRGGVHPAILVAADIAGADVILGLGGVQGIASLAFGLFTDKPADIIVGPGNAFVAEAKRQLFGEVGIDVIAGPTESMIVADDTADAHRVATDLVGQAEHGPDSPVWLVTTSAELAAEVARRVPELAGALPESARTSALTAWEHHGEIIVADTREDSAAVCDSYAAEHLQVMAADLPWWHERLTNYGSLFLGEEATVTFGDKSSGPNHILPTRRAARYTGGLNVLKFLKQLTYQELTPEAAQHQGELAARISRYEGMEGHARSADLRAEQITPTDPLQPPIVDLDFTAQEPLPDQAVRRVQQLLGSGKLFRYGESGAEQMDAALLEEEFASLVGRRFCVAFNSCGASLAAALIAAGVERDEKVLMNAFTLAPVPGAIAHAGAQPVFVDITTDYHIDLDDLRRQHGSTGARWLLLSYMRGHIPNLDAVMAVCAELGIAVVEDCAHTMGGAWDGRPTGTFGIAGCFSTQSFKHVNSGEGGLLVTDDEDLAARAILLSGSYMLYGQHGARPGDDVFERHRLTTPNFSMRMSALTAALVRPQLGLLAKRAEVWNARYAQLAESLGQIDGVRVPERDRREQYVASSIQFNVDHADIAAFVLRAASSGVELKWFGAEQPKGFTSRFDHWRYAPEQSVPRAAEVLATLIDMRIPLAMTSSQVEQIVRIITTALDR